MSAQFHAEARQSPEGSPALMDTVDAVADMAHLVKLNGPERTYANEKLSYALYKSAEALALCGADIGEVITEACRGFRHGRSLTDRQEDGR
jgi:hypothetical protein